MPAAWCTTKWKSEPASISAASAPGGASGLHGEHGSCRHAGHHEGVGVLVGGQGSRLVAIEVESAEADGADLHRETEHRPGPGSERRAA